MNWTDLDQGKYSIEHVFNNQNASYEVRRLTLDFHNALVRRMKKLNLKFYGRTHIRGISCMYNERKSFMPTDIFKNHIAINFWTGDKYIDGLKKVHGEVGNLSLPVANVFHLEVEMILNRYLSML